MDAIVEFMTGTVAVVGGGFLVVLALGWFLLWRSRRKLRQTT
jgi:hypothetical protein